MTVISLASISLLALVVTAAPLPNSNDGSQIERTSLDVQNTMQTLFESRLDTPAKCLGCEEGSESHTHVAVSGDQEDFLGGLENAEVVPAVNPVDLNALQDSDGVASLEPTEYAEDPTLANTRGIPFGVTHRQAIVTLTYAALGVTLGCVFGLLYLRYMLRTPVISPSSERKDLEKGDTPQHVEREDVKYCVSEKQSMPIASGPILERPLVPPIDEEKRALQVEYATSESDDSEEDLNEKFVDAEEPPVSLLDTPVPEMPRIVIQQHPDPDLLPLPTDRSSTPFSTPPPTPPRSPLRRPLQMREANLSHPTARPAWSLRAADAPSLGLGNNPNLHRPTPSPSPAMRSISPLPVSRPDTPVMHVPGAFSDEEDEGHMVERPSHSRAYRAPVPELDIAFAMQLRPGLGLGSDPAWLVRFLMAMFGWMTVFIGNGSHPRQVRRAIA